MTVGNCMQGIPFKPGWLKIRPPTTTQYAWLKNKIAGAKLHTICQEAHCPNMAECWSAGTASFMVLGSVCTRGCQFCAVRTAAKGEKIGVQEPKKLALTVKEMNLNYVVITSVNRDDLPDQGAQHFAACIRAIKELNPKTIVEVLAPDFQGKKNCIKIVLNAEPAVFGHNLETVKRLQEKVRDRRANYKQSLSVLELAKQIAPQVFTKSALMLGMGESKGEVLEAMNDLRKANVELLSMGQYLQPSPKHFPLQRYITPAEFEELKQIALTKGFLFCQSEPFVRSSYKAEKFFVQQKLKKNGAKDHATQA